MRDVTIRVVGATVVLIGIAVAALAQNGSGDPSAIELTADTVPVAGESSTTLPPSSTQPPPFEYRVGLLSGVSTANYWEYIGEEPTVWNAYVLGPTKPALYAVDPAGNLIPELAAEGPVEAAQAGQNWTVTLALRPDLTWSDGTPITTHDLVFTFNTVRSFDLGGGWEEAFPAAVSSVTAEDDHTVTVSFEGEPSLAIWPTAVGLAPVMPRHVWEDLVEEAESAGDLYAADPSDDLSGGPLEIVTIDEGGILAQANPGYPERRADTVRFEVFENEEAAVAALDEGAIDTILSPKGLLDATVEQLADNPDVAIEVSPANAVRYLGFNLTRAPMNDSVFRQAIARLLDREAAVAEVDPASSAAYTMLPPANETWFDAQAAESIRSRFTGPVDDRLDAALQILEEGGYTWETRPRVSQGALVAGGGLLINGAPPAPLTILTSGDAYDPKRPDYANLIEETIEILGFDVRTVITDFESVVDLAFTTDAEGARQYDMYLLGWTLGNPALPDYYRWFFGQDAPVNSTGYASENFDQALSRYETARTHSSALAGLWEMEQAIADELPYLVLYHPQIVEAYRLDRVSFELSGVLGGLQGRSGGLEDLIPVQG